MRILLAEDHPVSRKMLANQLKRWGYDVKACADGTEAWDALSKDDAPSLVILDWMMPGLDGPALCRLIRSLERQPYTYIILLTARNSVDDIVGGLDAGADDYIIKPCDYQELQVRLRAGSRIVRLHAELLEALKSREFEAAHDTLTGLWNRGAIMEILKKEIVRSQREGSALGVIISDADHFKSVNDEHGHMAGDAVLAEIGRRLVSGVRPYDSVGRYGGEEFIIVLPGCDQGAAFGLADRIRESFVTDPITTPEGVFPLTMSFGVSSLNRENAPDLDSMIRIADEALYLAKKLGRNRVETLTK